MTKHFFLIPAIALALLMPPQPARTAPTAQASGPQAVQTASGEVIPAGAFGIVHIPHVTSASLLQLHGKAGRGVAILRTRKPGHCVTMELRFVAGGFDGTGITLASDGPIRLILRSETVVAALMNGHDVVSDSYSLGDGTEDKDADFLVQTGLSADNGFVLNPGRNGWAELFGAEHIDTTCTPT